MLHEDNKAHTHTYAQTLCSSLGQSYFSPRGMLNPMPVNCYTQTTRAWLCKLKRAGQHVSNILGHEGASAWQMSGEPPSQHAQGEFILHRSPDLAIFRRKTTWNSTEMGLFREY